MRLTRSLSFRLALLYAALFTLSVLILLGLYYWISIMRPTFEVQSTLDREVRALEEVHRAGGARALAAALDSRAARVTPRYPYHALIAPDGQPLTSNLPSWPPASGREWLTIEADVYRDGDEDDHEALVLDRRLGDGSRLLLGYDVEDLDEIDEAVRAAAVWFLPALLVLVVGGSALMSRAIGRRIDAMSAAALQVMEGDLSGRVPTRGSNDDFDRLGARLNAMLERIETSFDAVRRVSDSVAHELRTPLARLRADLAELSVTPPEQAMPLIARAEAESERLSRMFDAVLRVSRIEARRHNAELRPSDLSEIVADAADYHAPQADERDIRFKTEIEAGLCIPGDRDLLFQAVSNLIDNAIKFTPIRGDVKLVLRREGDGIILLVDDSGPGMPDDLIAKAGERFFRSPGAAATPGFGLGLAFVKAVADLHNSKITLANGAHGLRVKWRFDSICQAQPRTDERPGHRPSNQEGRAAYPSTH